MKEINNILKLIGIVIFIILINSCSEKKSENEDSFYQIDDAGIRYQLFQLEKIGWKSRLHIQKVDDIIFTATEIPIQYYLLKDQGNQDLFNIDSLYQINKRERVVEFTFEQDEEDDLLKEKFTSLNYEDGIKYLSFSIDKDFYAVTKSKDTIRCSGVQYERNFKIAPFQKILLYFSGISPEEEIQLIYNDRLFQKGIIKFKFKDTFTNILL
jgi:hypothetical protein